MEAETYTRLVGQAIRSARELTGLSQEAFARKVGLDRSYYGRIERGGQNLSMITLCQVAGGLGIVPAKLLPAIEVEHGMDPERFAPTDDFNSGT